jgi:hypothetical protein
MSENAIVIRPSSLSDWIDCPRRAAARHLQDMLAAAGYTVAPRRPAHIGASVGTGLHAGAAATLIARLSTGRDAPAADADEIALTEMRQRMTDEGCEWDDVTRDLSTAERQLRRMMAAWREFIAPTLRPQLVEERLEVVVADGILMSGQMDVADSAGNGIRIRDNKTTKQKRAAHAQLGAYGLLLNSHGHTVTGLAIDHVQRAPLREPQPEPQTREVPLRDAVEDALQAVDDIGRRVALFRERAADPNGREPIAAFPANPSSALCSARFCPAHSTNTCRVHV